jgi:hypothetical protein
MDRERAGTWGSVLIDIFGGSRLLPLGKGVGTGSQAVMVPFHVSSDLFGNSGIFAIKL